MLQILLELLHILIGLIIVGFIIWVIIKIHNYFSQNNKPVNENKPLGT